MHNIQQAMKHAQALQSKIADLQKKLETELVEGTAGGNLVKVTCTCKGTVKDIKIDDSMIDLNEKEMLIDLLIAAFNNARKNSDAKTEQEMQKISASSGIPLDVLNQAF